MLLFKELRQIHHYFLSGRSYKDNAYYKIKYK